MRTQAEVSRLRATDALLMLCVLVGLVFALLLQTVPNPDLLVDAVQFGVEPLAQRLLELLVIGLALLVDLLLELLS